MLIVVLGSAALGLIALWAFAVVFLAGEDLARFDEPAGERFGAGAEPSTELKTVIASLSGIRAVLRGVPLSGRIAALRRYIDDLFGNRAFDASFVAVDCAGVAAEWVLPPGADGTRRTLYIHGGGFVIGSPRSHRTLTTRFAAMTGGAVLAIDYRLMPEHRRMAGIEDCRTAYCWMLANGPAGPEAAQAVFVAGESAGGNLALALAAWVRDQRLRAPDAVVALSPATDGTLASPGLRANRRSDAMLGPLYGPLALVPGWILLWLAWIVNRVRPSDPSVSPVYGDLANLPPILVHACEVEMLVDDGRRYVNRARAAGSPARLQTWRHGVHAWHIFNPELPEAVEALEEIGKFLAEAAPPTRRAPGERT